MERSKDLDNQPLDFGGAVWFNFGKGERLVDGKLVVFEHPHEVWVRHTYDVNEKPKRVSFIKKRGIQSGFDSLPPPLYDQYPVAIKKAKAEDLKKLVTKYVMFLLLIEDFTLSYLLLIRMMTQIPTATKALCYYTFCTFIYIVMHVLFVGDYCITM